MLCQGQQVLIIINRPEFTACAAGVTRFAAMLEPPSIENSADAENCSEILLVTTMHSITDDCGALIGHHFWDATAGSGCGMVATACAALPGVTDVAPEQA